MSRWKKAIEYAIEHGKAGLPNPEFRFCIELLKAEKEADKTTKLKPKDTWSEWKWYNEGRRDLAKEIREGLEGKAKK